MVHDPEMENGRYTGPERRAGDDRRSGEDRRKSDAPWPEDQERRSGNDRRTGVDRRTIAHEKQEKSRVNVMADSLSNIRAILKATPDRWKKLAEAYPVALLIRTPAPKEWSAVQCLLHLLDTERHVFPVRVRRILEGDELLAYDPEAQMEGMTTDSSVSSLAEEFARLRKSSLELVETLIPGDLERTAVHEEMGEVTLSQLMNEWAAHDIVHTMQAERAMIQPFLRASGPWMKYFEDHLIGEA